tara:strand:+ start:340 stop:534 length:195 start_codon:yes stop_codon:yes gene_type:complete
MKIGDLVEFINPVDKVVYRNAVGLVTAIEKLTPDDPDPTMVTIYMKNEDESGLYDFPIELLEVV